MAHVKAKSPKQARSPVNPYHGKVYQPITPSVGGGPVTPWNYKELPEDDPERVRIESMFAKLRPVRTTFGTYGRRGQP